MGLCLERVSVPGQKQSWGRTCHVPIHFSALGEQASLATGELEKEKPGGSGAGW